MEKDEKDVGTTQGVYNRRKLVLIKKRIQIRYGFFVLILCCLAAIVAGGTVFFTGWMLFGEKLSQIYPQGRLMPIIQSINFALIRNMLFVLPIVFLLSVWATHKIAGPLYRLERLFADMGRGDLYTIAFRKGDQLQELEEEVNDMVQKLTERQRIVDNNMKKVIDTVNELAKKAPSKELKEAQEALNAMRSHMFMISE